METSATPTNASSSSSDDISSNSASYGIQAVASNIIQGPLSGLLEYSGILGGGGRAAGRSNSPETVDNNNNSSSNEPILPGSNPEEVEEEEVSIRIIGAEHEHFSAHQHIPANPAHVSDLTNSASATRSYDVQRFVRWLEQILPFSLLLLLVFIRQHLQGIPLLLRFFFFSSSSIMSLLPPPVLHQLQVFLSLFGSLPSCSNLMIFYGSRPLLRFPFISWFLFPFTEFLLSWSFEHPNCWSRRRRGKSLFS